MEGWRKCRTVNGKKEYLDEIIKLKTDQKVISFKNGVGTLTVSLQEPLTAENNPRSELKSLCLIGTVDITKNEGINPDNQFTVMFYQNEEKNKNHTIDWVSDIGPLLKNMALLYPAMQNIVDLYTFK